MWATFHDSSHKKELRPDADERRALWEALRKQPWTEGDLAPHIEKLDVPFEPGVSSWFWVIFRGTTETGSHVDEKGQPITARCMHVHAQRAKSDVAVGLLKPHPYFLGFLMWPEITIYCETYDSQNKNLRNFDLGPPSGGPETR